MPRRPTLKETIQAALAGYAHELVVLPGWPQYCVTRAVLHRLVDDAETFSWMTRREKQWLIAYVQVAGQSRSRLPTMKPSSCTSKPMPWTARRPTLNKMALLGF